MEATGVSLIMLLLLGALHGINPGMGWLFAVSLGLQEQRRGAVIRALGPLAAGHALAIAAAVLLAAALGLVLPTSGLKWVAAAALVGFGVYRLFRHRHPRYGGMRVGARQLTIWSFLMASAHGAGLMAVPFVLDASVNSGTTAHAHHHHATAPAPPEPAAALTGNGLPVAAATMGGSLTEVFAVLAHTAGYLLVAGLVAILVFDRFGLRGLRTSWINIDLVWSGALILTGILTPLI